MKKQSKNVIDLRYSSVERLVEDIEALKKVSELTQQGVEIRIKVRAK